MKFHYAFVLAVWVLPAVVSAQTGYSISGGLSNFDCGNRCDSPCDEFEIDIEDLRPEDVVHTWSNSNYGAPSVTLSADGTYTIIDYHHPQHLTAVGAVEHFGVSLRQLTSYNTIRVRWMVNGQAATVNGQIPVPGGGSAPATQPLLPSISTDLTSGTSTNEGISLSVTNNDPAQCIWIQRRAQVTQGAVALEALLPNSNVVTTTVPIDNAPILLGPGQTLSTTSDLVEAEDNQSVVFTAQYFQDLMQNGPFNNSHGLGPELGNVMTATIASPGSLCGAFFPTIARQPASVTADEGRPVALSVEVTDDGPALTYEWMKEGVALSSDGQFSGVHTSELNIESLDAAAEGFYSVRVTNECGSSVSQSALVFITGHNPPPDHAPLCVAITAQPQAATVCAYGLAQFAVSVDGAAPFLYQWQAADPTAPDGWSDLLEGFNAPGDSALLEAAGTNDPLLTVILYGAATPGPAAMTFRCVVSNDCDSLSSATATLLATPPAPADLNLDCAVDLDDVALLADCTSGPGVAPAPGCEAADFDHDNDVDQDDFGILQRCFRGPGVPASPDCGG